MTIALRYAARSDVGLLRSSNQDSGYAGPHLLVLADGMGGPKGGDIASSVAIAHLAPLDGEAHGADDILALIEKAAGEAQAELRARAVDDPALAGLGTTLIAALRSGNKLAMAHVGDSRAYLVRDGALSRLTVDHTYVQHLVDLGQITEEEAEQHPHRSVIVRVLGDHDMGVELDTSVREIRAGDRYLFCSDGLSSYVSADTITETLLEVGDVGQCADDLVDLALRAGGPDNVTVVIADAVDVDHLPDGRAPDTQPQVVGAATSHWRQPTRGGSSAAARAAALTSRPHEEDDGESSPRPARRRRWGWVLGLVALLVVAAGLASGYRWTQTQHFVAQDEGAVTIYRGIPQELGPLTLSSVVERTDVQVADLPAFAQARLERTIVPDGGTLLAAEEVVASLRSQASTPEDDPADDGTSGGTDTDSDTDDTGTDPAAPTPTSPAPSPSVS